VDANCCCLHLVTRALGFRPLELLGAMVTALLSTKFSERAMSHLGDVGGADVDTSTSGCTHVALWPWLGWQFWEYVHCHLPLLISNYIAYICLCKVNMDVHSFERKLLS
jgi:hypothetical protein